MKLALFLSFTFFLVKVIPNQKDGGEFAILASESIEKGEYCTALSMVGRALKDKPWSSRYLTAWANLKPLVDRNCNLPFTDGDPINSIEVALLIHPLDFDVLLAAASLYFEKGKHEDAYKLLRRTLSFDRGFSQTRVSRIMSMIRSKEAVQAVFLAKFPQAVTWRSFLKESRYPEVRDMADQLLFSAIKHLGDYPLEIREQHLLSIYLSGVSGKLRIETDRAGSKIFRDRNSWNNHKYLDLRSELVEVRREFGLVDAESSSFRNQVIKWGAPINITFGEEPASFGFYVPDGAEYLEFELMGKMPRLEAIKFLVSSDNINWSETGFKDKPSISNFAGRTWILLRLPEGVKYGKVFVQDNRLKPSSKLISTSLYSKVSS